MVLFISRFDLFFCRRICLCVFFSSFAMSMEKCVFYKLFFLICLLLKHFVCLLEKCGNQCRWYFFFEDDFAIEPRTRNKQIFTDECIWMSVHLFQSATEYATLHHLRCWCRFAVAMALKTFGRMNSIAQTATLSKLNNQ